MVRVAQTDLMPDFAGRKLNGVQLMEFLGSGAYGKVYRAYDTPITPQSKVYAVKCLNKPEPGSRTELLQQREFSLHKLVSAHPNIVTFHRHFRDDRYVYVVLDLCRGGDLFGAITERHIFQNDDPLVKNAFLQLIDAVQYCHDLGVFHRDIKPENVLCSNDGTDIRLADFGLSIQSPVCHDFGCGSSYYMSPECIGKGLTSGKYSTRHNDVWALGVILTNMITGRNPWRYATSDDDCYAAYTQDNDFLRHVLPISAGVNEILKKVFTTNPLQRISLPSFRKAIVELDTFFDVDPLADAHKLSSKGVKKAPPAEIHQPAKSLALFPSTHPTKPFEGSDEHYVFSSPVVNHPHLEPGPGPGPGHTSKPKSRMAQSIKTSNFIIGDSGDSLAAPSSGSLSGPESKGPITPETIVVDPSIAVSDIPEEEGLGKPIKLPGATFISKFKPTTIKTKKSRGGQFIRSAIQRLKGLSSSTSA